MNYIFYHSNCMDGLCAAWVTWHALQNKRAVDESNITLKAVHYQNPIPEFDYHPQDTVYIVDFSYPREELILLNHKCKVVVLDHHASAEKQLADLPFAYFDMNKSGAGMAWEYFYGTATEMPYVVAMVQDRDLWKSELPGTKAFSTALQDDPRRHDMAFWASMVNDHSVVRELIVEGTVLVNQVNGILKNFIEKEKYKIITWCGYKVALFNTTSLFSEMGEYAYQQLPIDLSMSYFINQEGRVIFSLRAPKGGVNVGELATRFGGGGHAGASGFSYEGIKGMKFLNDLYLS